MILVAGGSGRLGTLVVRGLAAQGHGVRVLTRDARRAEHLTTVAELAIGDVRDARSLDSVMADVTVVVSAVHGMVGPRGISPKSVDDAGNLALFEAGRAAGVDVVLMSVVGAAPDSPLELFRAKWSAERHLQASALPATVVRASAFMETWIDVVREAATRSGRPRVFGRGDNPINFVSATDVAGLVVRAVEDSSTRSSTLEIGGPENFTLRQFAEMVAAADDRPLPPVHVPRGALRLMAATVGSVSPELGRKARAAIAMDTAPLSIESGRAPTRLEDVLRIQGAAGRARLRGD